MSDYNSTLKSQCRQDSLFQDKKSAELMFVHNVLKSDEWSDDEKYVMLVTEGHYGKERAQMLVFGYIKYKDEPYEFNEYVPIADGRIR